MRYLDSYRGRAAVWGLLVILLMPSALADISGRVWEDTNRNGLQDAGETGIPDIEVYLTTSIGGTPLATSVTAAAGGYAFTGLVDDVFYVTVVPPTRFAFTIPDAGTDDTIDSDIAFDVYGPIPYAGVPVTHIDAGLYSRIPGIRMQTTANGIGNGQPLFITNGASVRFVHSIVNTGETHLSQTFIFNPVLETFIDIASCPSSIQPGGEVTYTTQLVVTASTTNHAQVIAFPSPALTCDDIPGLDPVWHSNFSEIIIVTNDPLSFVDGDALPNDWEIRHGLDPLNPSPAGANTDGDWMTDHEEYIADTDPTNSASYLPGIRIDAGGNPTIANTSTSRVYALWMTTNLMIDPAGWSLADEQTGSGAVITFPATNSTPHAIFRAGVRLP